MIHPNAQHSWPRVLGEVFLRFGRNITAGTVSFVRQILKVLAWFVVCGGDCRYKWEKKSGNFLEIEKNLRNFASSSEKTTSEWQEKKTISLTIKNSKIMVKKNEEESPRTLKKEELENVNGGQIDCISPARGGNKKRPYEPWSTDRYSILFQIEKRKSDRLPLLYYNLTTMCVLVLGQGGRRGAWPFCAPR